MSLGNCKVTKSYHNTTITLIIMLKLKAAAKPKAGKGGQQQGLLFIADGNARWYRYSERQFSSSYKARYTLTI